MRSLEEIREINREPSVEDYGLTLEEMLIFAREVEPSSWRYISQEDYSDSSLFYEGKAKGNRKAHIAVRLGYGGSYIEVLSEEIPVGYERYPGIGGDFGKEFNKIYFLAEENAKLYDEKKEKKEKKEQNRLIEGAKELAKSLKGGKE